MHTRPPCPYRHTAYCRLLFAHRGDLLFVPLLPSAMANTVVLTGSARHCLRPNRGECFPGLTQTGGGAPDPITLTYTTLLRYTTLCFPGSPIVVMKEGVCASLGMRTVNHSLFDLTCLPRLRIVQPLRCALGFSSGWHKQQTGSSDWIASGVCPGDPFSPSPLDVCVVVSVSPQQRRPRSYSALE